MAERDTVPDRDRYRPDKGAQLKVRVSDSEREALHRVAAERGTTTSVLLRQVVRDMVGEVAE